LPLVLVFHGGYLTPKQMAATTKMHELAAREGFIVSYPAAIKPERHWNDGRGWYPTLTMSALLRR